MNIEEVTKLPRKVLLQIAHHVGNTPMKKLDLFIQDQRYEIYLKLEGGNPTGSVKDRTAYGLMQDLEQRRHLCAENIIVESTSGNLGVALALQCKARGYQFIAVVDPKTTPENIAKMQMFGACIDMVERPDENNGYLLTRLQRVHDLCTANSNYIWVNQYSNLANPTIHYMTTGPEIYRQVPKPIDAVFVAVSTGGTLAGIGHYFHEVSPHTRIIGVDIWGSVVFQDHAAARLVTGIGSSRHSDFLAQGLYDDHVLVDDMQAIASCRTFAKETGLKVGGSSGAVLAACAKYIQLHPNLKNSVCICPDFGENYASSIYNDDWYQQKKSLHHGEIAEPDIVFSLLENTITP